MGAIASRAASYFGRSMPFGFALNCVHACRYQLASEKACRMTAKTPTGVPGEPPGCETGLMFIATGAFTTGFALPVLINAPWPVKIPLRATVNALVIPALLDPSIFFPLGWRSAVTLRSGFRP